ncbi:uncharacterized protein MELLADRAFT_70153 [Melampsora larici-populina 98AG31]|uniref:Uncharacterized protein n=1 Tax=Melampsora larici-populina (strain 98AG31 / pathotype 3-4-7) TaxID=747676 RepID=F4SDT8_MELLP|nr:uncharacterized protein MELLADRAFT_70153 [Melampsora larici-populina 98AG31]EGF97189.1 hypothetical protein MELLADRAFT_70153 [Melampsora larici-populina 98AG31]
MTIGDILEFGELNIGQTSLAHRKEVPRKMEILYENFVLQNNVLPWHDSPERAWLESQPELWKLYQERFQVVILAFETLNSSHVYTLLSYDVGNNMHAWWHFGDYLMWIDEGLDHQLIMEIGDSLKLGKDRANNAKILASVNWKKKLERYDHEAKLKIKTYFEKRRILYCSELQFKAPLSTTEWLKRTLHFLISWL